MTDLSGTRIAVIGGSGKLGSALARRWARAGLHVLIGSRSAEIAAATAAVIGFRSSGHDNAAAAAQGDIIVLTVPFAAQDATLDEIAPHVAGKLVIDTTVPLMPPRVMQARMPPEGSAAMRTQARLGDGVIVASGFHSVAAHKLATDDAVECDVLAFSDDRAARETVVALARKAGLRGLHGGALVNSVAAEAMTSVLIFMNRTYRIDGAGLRITGSLTEPGT